MCGRYRLDAGEPETDLQSILDELNRRQKQGAVKTSGELRPGDRVPALCRDRRGEIGAFALEWGYRMGDGRRLINARLETAAQKPIFRDGMENRRCLLPLSAYYEWEKRGSARIKYRIAPAAEGLYCLAGIYRLEESRAVCTVLTTGAAAQLAFIHDRMPVLLPYRRREAWLLGGALEEMPKEWIYAPEGDVQLSLF